MLLLNDKYKNYHFGTMLVLTDKYKNYHFGTIVLFYLKRVFNFLLTVGLVGMKIHGLCLNIHYYFGIIC